MRTITINFGPGVSGRAADAHGGEVLNEYGETTGLLSLGELIEHVIYTIQGKSGYQMLTPERWEQRWQRTRERFDAVESVVIEPIELHSEDPDHGEHLA